AITGLEDMLRRLLGPGILLEQHLAEDLHRIRADQGQIEQVIMNLVVNAHDAMPEGGVLTIASSNLEVSAQVGVPPGEGTAPPPGSYCHLTVRDTGMGMGVQTQARAFEPFFTTKAQGKGTGLGLSTV